MKALRKYLLAALVLCAGAGIVLFPGELSEAVRGSVGGCLEVVIPALFAFTVLAVYLQRSGLYRVVLKPLTVPLSKLLRLPEELCAVFLLSNIGGYPGGAKLLTPRGCFAAATAAGLPSLSAQPECRCLEARRRAA